MMARALAMGALASAVLASGTSAAQPGPPRTRMAEPSRDEAHPEEANFKHHFGVDLAQRLIAGDPGERLRGIARAAAIHSPEALRLLVHASEQNGPARADARAMIEVARALASFVDDAHARNALIGLVNASPPSTRATAVASGGGQDFASEEAEVLARTVLARQTAAIALAASGDARAIEGLVAIARGGGVGQPAAAMAIATFPPVPPGTLTSVQLNTSTMLRVAAQTGDLRLLEAVRGLAVGGNDPVVRAAALLVLGELGDMRGIDAATKSLKERDGRVRSAATEVLVLLAAPDAAKAVEALLQDDATAGAGVRLAEHAHSDGIVKALSARAVASGDPLLRSAAVAALGRAPLASATKALVTLANDASLEGDAANALARSPAPGAMDALAAMAENAAKRRLAVRAYVVRVLVRGETNARLASTAASLARGPGVDRSVGVFAEVALGRREAAELLADSSPQVRRAAAMGALARGPDARTQAAMLAQLVKESDAPTRDVLGLGLLGGDPESRVPTLTLVDHAEGGGPDAGLATLALARRGGEAVDAKVTALLASRDPVRRTHAARGLATSALEDSVGRLADAYAYEPDSGVRRAIIAALASRSGGDAEAPARLATLRLGSRLDPDPIVRAVATRALAHLPAAPAPSARREVAWIRLATEGGRAPPPGMTGALVCADGVALPIAFDDDGYAVVPGVAPGEARLVLAPRVPVYEASKP